MSDDLERDLRAMLTDRANDIRSVPDTVRPLCGPDEVGVDDSNGVGEVLEVGAMRAELLASARRRWPVLVVAAAVLAVLGGVLAVLVVPSPHVRTPSVHHAPKLKTVTRTACKAALPASWQGPVSTSAVALPSLDSDPVVAVTGDGGAVVETPVHSSSSFIGDRVGYVAPGASTVRWLGTFGDRSAGSEALSSFGLEVDVTGHTLVVSIESGHHKASAHASVPQTLHEIVAVDLESGRHTVLARIAHSAGTIGRQAYAQDGVAYWQVEAKSPSKPNHTVEQIFSRPVDGGPLRKIASGGYYDLQKSALGIEWNLDGTGIDRPADLPPVVQRTVTSQVLGGTAALSYVTDGNAWAWQTERGGLDWYDPSSGRLVRIPALLGRPDTSPGQALVYSVAGPLVYFQDKQGTADRLIDVRTGAVLPVLTGQLFGSHGTVIGSSDSLGADVVASGGNLMRLPTADLPPASC